MLVSKTVPSSSVPLYQQLTVSPFLGKLVLSPFFRMDFVNFGGPWGETTRAQRRSNTHDDDEDDEGSTSSTASVLLSLGVSWIFTAWTSSVTSSTSVPLNLWETLETSHSDTENHENSAVMMSDMIPCSQTAGYTLQSAALFWPSLPHSWCFQEVCVPLETANDKI